MTVMAPFEQERKDNNRFSVQLLSIHRKINFILKTILRLLAKNEEFWILVKVYMSNNWWHMSFMLLTFTLQSPSHSSHVFYNHSSLTIIIILLLLKLLEETWNEMKTFLKKSTSSHTHKHWQYDSTQEYRKLKNIHSYPSTKSITHK